MDLTALQRMDLSGNALSGPVSSLPPLLLDLKLNNNQFTDLSVITPFLSAADVSFNELVTLGDLTGNNLKTLKVENNNLTFEDLEPNVPIPVFVQSSGQRGEQAKHAGGAWNVRNPGFNDRWIGQCLSMVQKRSAHCW